MIEQYDYPELESIYWSDFTVVEFLKEIGKWLHSKEAKELSSMMVGEEQ